MRLYMMDSGSSSSSSSSSGGGGGSSSGGDCRNIVFQSVPCYGVTTVD